jgi:1-acyl-sn-glycerol-3-phosphate acyltransferase
MIKTVFVFGYLVFTVIFLFPFGVIAMLFYFLGLRKLMTLAVYGIALGWARALIKITGCKVAVSGVENIPKKGGVCFVSNHCGYFDIVLLFACCGRPIGFIAKKELMFIPLLNLWIYMIGGLYIDRGSLRKAVRTINRGVQKIKSGGGIIIFPEGHRSKGRGLLPFHPGSLKLATMAEAPIVPVAIEGSYDVFEKTYRVTGASAKVTFCEPIDTARLPPQDRKVVLSDRIYAVIKEKLEN